MGLRSELELRRLSVFILGGTHFRYGVKKLDFECEGTSETLHCLIGHYDLFCYILFKKPD